MAVVSRRVDYSDQGVALQGVLYRDDSLPGRRPAVLVSHAWGGQDDFARNTAEKLAGLGYAGFALDMYGKGVTGSTVAECNALIGPFMQDRRLVARRQQLALNAVRAQAEVDSERVAAIGFCFGGLCVLDLARSGAALRGVVSFHGLLKPNGLPAARIAAKVLVLHGDADPMAPVEDVVALRRELTEAGADWQLHMYGNTLHGFAVPGANLPDIGVKHSESAQRRSEQAMRNFLEEVLA